MIARTAQGRLRGTTDGDAVRFLGIPYAVPPGQTGRFAAPVPHPPWDGVRDALRYGASSAQPERGATTIPEPVIAGDNELNLNVFTPSLGAAALPVLVWIHGGGYYAGGSSSPWYRGGAFARDGVVLVSINYRLGAPGFLELPGAPANRAVRDWILALEWVQQNVAAFGGDPATVTIGGQSAGGGACATLLGAPRARGLFRRAICMSGGAALTQTPAGVRAVAAKLAKRLGVPLTGEAFDAVPADVLLAGQAALLPGGPDTVTRDAATVAAALSTPRLPWAPWTDGEVVTDDPVRAAADPRQAGVGVLAGATAHEFTGAWRAADWVTGDIVREAFAALGVPAAATEDYLARGQRPGEVVGQAMTDRTFRVPAQELAAAKADAGGAAFVYDFRWAAPSGLAFHCLDVPFAFGNLGEPGVMAAAGPAPPEELAGEVHGALVRFVTGGDPGWPRYDTGARQVMLFGTPSAVAAGPLAAERAAWAR